MRSRATAPYTSGVRSKTARLGWVLLLPFVALVVAMLLVHSNRPAASAASATPPVIWLHYDYLTGAPDGHSDAPDPAALQLVVDAFTRHGITLTIDPQHSAIPWKPYTTMDAACAGTDTLLLADVKARYFHPTSKHQWDYVLFGSRIKASDSAPSCAGDSPESGLARPDAYDFVIDQDYLTSAFNGDVYAVGGSFMHELGHNLGLRHGGGGDENFKPNYISVMNYPFDHGIPFAATPGSAIAVGYRLDYSEGTLPPLDEAHLNESLGIGGGPNDRDITFWTVCTLPHVTRIAWAGPAHGPIDWDLSGTAGDTNLRMNVSYDREQCGQDPRLSPTYHVLHDFDDWAEIRAYVRGQHIPSPPVLVTDGQGKQPVGSGGVQASGPAAGSAASAPPVVTSLSPASGASGTTVTLTGAHFTGATFVGTCPTPDCTWPFTVSNDTTIVTRVPAAYASLVSANNTRLYVATPAGWTIPDDNATYTVLPRPTPGPVITSLSQTSGPALGGTTLLIGGSGLSRVSAVSLGIPISSFQVISDTLITLTTPSVIDARTGQPRFGTVAVRIRTASGQANASFPVFQFTYLPVWLPMRHPVPQPAPFPRQAPLPILFVCTITIPRRGARAAQRASKPKVRIGTLVVATGLAESLPKATPPARRMRMSSHPHPRSHRASARGCARRSVPRCRRSSCCSRSSPSSHLHARPPQRLASPYRSPPVRSSPAPAPLLSPTSRAPS